MDQPSDNVQGAHVQGAVAGPATARPPLPPTSRTGARASPLQSYVSEPPSTLTMMKTFAQELLHQQHEQEAAAATAVPAAGTGQLPRQQQPGSGGSAAPLTTLHHTSSDGTAAAAPSSGAAGLFHTAEGLELPRLSQGATALAFERAPHFQLDPQLSSPRRRTASGVAADGAHNGGGGGRATAPLQPRLRTSIGWVTSLSPTSTSLTGSVLDHRVAGDLIMPVRAPQPAGAGRGLAASAAGGSPSKEGGGMRRRPILRTSQQSGPASPSPKGGTARGAEAGGPGGGDKQTSPAKKPDAMNTDQDDLESLDFEGEHKPWWKKKSFWLVAGPLLISLAFVLAGTLYITLGKKETLSKFEIWRLCYFFAGLPIIWWIGRGVMELAVWGVEKTMFTWANALYYCYAVRRPMANLIRAALTTGWWAIMMTSFSSSMDATLLKWYNNVLKVLGCLTLFMLANLLKVLFAKMMARKFNQHSHYAKMHHALKREYLLHTLLQPRRQHYAELEELEGEEMDGEEEGLDEEGQGEGGDMHRTKSAPAGLRSPQKQTSLQRLFRKGGMLASQRQRSMTHAAEAKASPPHTSFKDKVLFWRSSAKRMGPIEEEEGGDGTLTDGDMEGSHRSSGKGGNGLPPDAVALDIAVDSSQRGATTTTPESPLLGQSLSSASLSMGPAKPSTAAAGSGAPGGAGSTTQPTPQASPPPLSKLARHRSDALEAIGVLQRVPLSPRAMPAAQRGAASASGSQTPVRRGLSGEQQQASVPPAASIGPDNERGRQLPPVRVSQGGGAAGSLAVSREPSVSDGRMAARLLHAPGAGAGAGPGLEIRRSASLQSRRSLQPQAARSPAKRALVHSPSSNSSREGSQKAIMALKMSKMEKYIRKHALEVTFKDALSRVERSEKVTTELEARKLGFYLFHNVKAEFDRDYVSLEDLEQFLDEKDAKAALDMLDADGNGQVNVQECCAAIANVFVERRNLAASLKDAHTIVGKLETVIGVVLHIFMGFLYLIIFEVDVMKTWAGFASLFLGFSFVFGNSIRTTYENVVFLFLVHPYDIGETLWIDNEQCKVAEIHLSFTVLINSSNARLWYPNEKIRVVPFINLSNSGPKGESFKVLVDLGTSSAVLDQLRSAADAVIKANPKEFNGTVSVNLREGGGPLKLMISVYYEFSHSGADGGRTARNRTKMLCALSEALQHAGVRYTWPATADGAHAASGAAGATDDAAASGTNAAMLL